MAEWLPALSILLRSRPLFGYRHAVEPEKKSCILKLGRKLDGILLACGYMLPENPSLRLARVAGFKRRSLLPRQIPALDAA